MAITLSVDDLDKLSGYGEPQPLPAPLPAPLAQPRAAVAPMAAPNVQPSGAPPALPVPAATIPDLRAPTKKESQEAGKREYAEGMPQVTAAPGQVGYGEQRQEQLDYEKMHPWGSDVSAHPGILGKIGHIASRVGNIAGDVLAPGVTALIPGSDLNKELQAKGNANWEDMAQTNALKGAEAKNIESETTARDQAVAGNESGAWKPMGEPRQDPTTGQWIQLGTSKDAIGNQTETWKPLEGGPALKPPEGTKPKAQIFATPFEAFLYGDPTQKQTAQDFLSLEKRLGRENDRPSDIEERYSLYQRDPQSYLAMFGDRGNAQDQAQATRDQVQATRMLNYFEKQRKAVQDDFTLDDQTKQQQLSQIDELEKPYLSAAQPSATPSRANAPGNGPQPGEVEVISPDGQRGYLPKQNLAKALKRGFRRVAIQ